MRLKRSSQLLEETEHFSRWRQKEVAKIVHYGVLQDFFEAVVPCISNYCAREIWKTEHFGRWRQEKLRRLSTVGNHNFEEAAGTTYFEAKDDMRTYRCI